MVPKYNYFYESKDLMKIFQSKPKAYVYIAANYTSSNLISVKISDAPHVKDLLDMIKDPIKYKRLKGRMKDLKAINFNKIIGICQFHTDFSVTHLNDTAQLHPGEIYLITVEDMNCKIDALLKCPLSNKWRPGHILVNENSVILPFCNINCESDNYQNHHYMTMQ